MEPTGDGAIWARDVRLTSCRPRTGIQGGPPWQSGFETPELHRLFGLRRTRQIFASPPAGPSGLPVRLRLDRAWFGGVLFPYYGHFLVESLGMLPNIPDDGSPIVLMALQNTITAWHRQFFADIGIASRLHFTDKSSTVEVGRLSKADQTTVFQGDVSGAYIRWMQSRFGASPRSGRRIYLSRRECRTARVIGEDQFEARLAGIGVESVVPEKLSIREQARMIDACDAVIAVEGSALHTLAFCPSAKNVIVLHRRNELEHAFWLQFAVQPHLRVTELRCMKRYAANFSDNAELDVDLAIAEIGTAIAGGGGARG